jgi:hypothetical protein
MKKALKDHNDRPLAQKQLFMGDQINQFASRKISRLQVGWQWGFWARSFYRSEVPLNGDDMQFSEDNRGLRVSGDPSGNPTAQWILG